MITNNQPLKNNPPTKKVKMRLCSQFILFFAKLFDCALSTIASAFTKIRFLKLFFQWKTSCKSTCEQKVLAEDKKDQHPLQQPAIRLQVFYEK